MIPQKWLLFLSEHVMVASIAINLVEYLCDNSSVTVVLALSQPDVLILHPSNKALIGCFSSQGNGHQWAPVVSRSRTSITENKHYLHWSLVRKKHSLLGPFVCDGSVLYSSSFGGRSLVCVTPKSFPQLNLESERDRASQFNQTDNLTDCQGTESCGTTSSFFCDVT